MNQEALRMSRKERERMVVMEQVANGTLALNRAAEMMGVCVRQAVRIKKRYAKQGPAGLVHRGRDRVSNRRLPKDLKERALALYAEHFPDFGPRLAAEKMEECHGLAVQEETLRLWLLDAHLWQGKRAARQHRRRRARRERFGELVQMDGSDHDWFEGRGPRCCLMVMVDDATGRIALLLVPSETTQSALMILRKWVEMWGIPEALYADGKTVYFPPEFSATGETEFGQVAHRMGIETIRAHSPQAKGRVERKNSLLQDRLVKEFREC
jgi:hypothetical protein